MVKKSLFGMLLLVLILLPLLVSCSSSTSSSTSITSASTSSTQQTTAIQTTTQPQTTKSTAATTTAPGATTTAQANWWDKLGTPKYGGTIVQRAVNLGSQSFDPYKMQGITTSAALFENSWTIDREIQPFKTESFNVEEFQGLAGKSWEQVDASTINISIRPEAKWQNKAPVNGRSFTADDVVFNYDRMMGTGSGFTEANPIYAGTLSNLQSVTALDERTIQYKFKVPSAWNIFTAMNMGMGSFGLIAPEWFEQGDLENWQNVVGTNPWFLTDFVRDSAYTYSKDPDFWWHDERYPQNKIPYIDSYKILLIPDVTTALGALRTGKIDVFPGSGGGVATWQNAKTLAEESPEIVQTWIPNPGLSLDLRCDNEPFTDIRVRKAMQMALDLKAIAQAVWGGVAADGTPAGLASPYHKGWITPYDEWPAELQQEYSYNVAAARDLMAEAGHPNGFNTNIVCCTTDNIDLLQVAKAYFSEIGINMDIKTLADFPTYMNYVQSQKNDQIALFNNCGNPQRPDMIITSRFTNDRNNATHNNDPAYDEIVMRFKAATTLDEARKIFNEADMYAIRAHWSVNIFPYNNPVFIQPWVKGWTVERTVDYARCWVDQTK